MQNRDSTLPWYNPHIILTCAFEVVFSFVLHSSFGVITAPLALYMPSTSVSLCGVLSSTLSCSQSWAAQVNLPGFGVVVYCYINPSWCFDPLVLMIVLSHLLCCQSLSESWCCWMSTLVMSTGSCSGMLLWSAFRSTGHLVLVLCDSCFSPMFL